jgi:hypothetical protein
MLNSKREKYRVLENSIGGEARDWRWSSGEPGSHDGH